VRGESPRAALPVHKEGLHFTIHYVLFDLEIGWDRIGLKDVITNGESEIYSLMMAHSLLQCCGKHRI
jgi:hypothetical protein